MAETKVMESGQPNICLVLVAGDDFYRNSFFGLFPEEKLRN
jgi:hypothetical protein